MTAAWRVLGPEQRAAGVGAVLLAISTLGPFSFIEAAILLVAAALLLLLKKRADGADFHLPFGDGAVTAAAGVWSGLLILTRLFDRPLGQELLALLCAAIVTAAGLSQRAHRPADDAAGRDPNDDGPADGDETAPEPGPARDGASGAAPARGTVSRPARRRGTGPADEAPTEPLQG